MSTLAGLEQQSPMLEDDVSRIIADTPCEKCGYNLRHQAIDSTCPECGYSVAQSLRPDRLVLADPQWVIGLANGFKWIYGGLAFGLLMFITMVVVVENLYTNPMNINNRTIELISWAFAMPPGLMIAWGCWLLSAPEPGNVSDLPPMSSRWIARVGLCITVVMAIMTGLFAVVDDLLTVLTFGVGCIAVTIAGHAALRYGMKLAMRIPHKKLAVCSKILFYTYMIITAASLAGFVIILFVNAVVDGSSFNTVSTIEDMLITAAIVIVLILILCWLALIVAGLVTLIIGAWYGKVINDIAKSLKSAHGE